MKSHSLFCRDNTILISSYEGELLCPSKKVVKLGGWQSGACLELARFKTGMESQTTDQEFKHAF